MWEQAYLGLSMGQILILIYIWSNLPHLYDQQGEKRDLFTQWVDPFKSDHYVGWPMSRPGWPILNFVFIYLF